MNENIRVAIVRGKDITIKQVRQYLPVNYDVMVPAYMAFDAAEGDAVERVQVLLIAGTDNCGWTLDGYVIPRLASGLMFAEELCTEAKS